MPTIGLIGWRGMVGSVLLQRMQQENDLDGLDVAHFTTSQHGQPGPDGAPLRDAHDLEALADCDILITCQGGDYTTATHGPLRATGWDGFWIDAASTLRMAPSSLIVLDPVNRERINRAIESGTRDFIGGNCTVSLMLMAVGELFRRGWVAWLSSMTYQSASGAGAAHMQELVQQMGQLGQTDPTTPALKLEAELTRRQRAADFPQQHFGAPLAASLIPWIDRAVDAGQTREEWKGQAETNRILGTEAKPIPIDGTCVRVGALRCHSQALTIKLTHDIPLPEIESALTQPHPWLRLIPNERQATTEQLTPAAISGSLDIALGRLRKMNMGPDYLSAFTVGDQLLWGAAEPLRRILRILLES